MDILCSKVREDGENGKAGDYRMQSRCQNPTADTYMYTVHVRQLPEFHALDRLKSASYVLRGLLGTFYFIGEENNSLKAHKYSLL